MKTAYIAALSSPIKTEYLSRGVQNLASNGIDAQIDPAIASRDWLTAGTADDRTAMIERWLKTDVETLWLARGGYGAEELNVATLLTNQTERTIIGSSDATILQLQDYADGPTMVYGPMVAASIAGSHARAEIVDLQSAMEPGAVFRWQATVHNRYTNSVSGSLWGGCLSLCVTAAIRGIRPPQNSILVLEDIGERPHKIARMMGQLASAGWFDELTAIVVGQFPGCEPVDGAGYTLNELLFRCLAPTQLPVYAGCPVGHVQSTVAVRSFVQGMQAVITT